MNIVELKEIIETCLASGADSTTEVVFGSSNDYKQVEEAKLKLHNIRQDGKTISMAKKLFLSS